MVIYEYMIGSKEDEWVQSISRLVPWKAIQKKISILGGGEFTIAQSEKAITTLLHLFGYPNFENDKSDIVTLQSNWNNKLESLPLSDVDKCLAAAANVTMDIEWYLRVCVKGAIREYAKSGEINENMKGLLDVTRPLMENTN